MKNKFNKFCSIILALAIILSTFVCIATTVAFATEKTYYVAPGGTGNKDGSSADNAFATVYSAITAANTASYGAGDTVYIKLVGTDNNLFGGTGSAAVTLPTHEFTLHISSAESTAKATVYNGGL